MFRAKTYCEKGLKTISLGKYETIMYSKRTGSSFSTSVLGGLVTLLLLLVIGGAIIVQLAQVLSLSHSNLDLYSEGLAAYQMDSNLSIHSNNVVCNDCTRLIISDFLPLLNNLVFYVNFEDPQFNCTTVTLTVHYRILDADVKGLPNYINLTTLSFNQTNKFACTFALSQLNIASLISQEEMSELIFFKSVQNGDHYSRFYYYIDGVVIGTTVQRKFLNSQISTAGKTEIVQYSSQITNSTIFFD